MSTGTTITCNACGHHGFIILDARTGEQVDLKTFYATIQPKSINPDDLKHHPPLDLSNLRTVCANPHCRRVLG